MTESQQASLQQASSQQAASQHTSVQQAALKQALDRLETLGRPLNAVVTSIPNPPHAAEGPLLGMPVAVKDMFDVAGQPRGNGNPEAMTGPPATADAAIVTALRAAGADVFALSAMLEYAAGAQHPDLPEARNPVDPRRTAGGSSGGSAALVGAGVCPAALGSDTGGSIRVPAHYCGVVGFKPTFGVLPLEGAQALAPSLDHAGLLAVDVTTTATVFAAVSGIRTEPWTGELRVAVLTDQLDDPELDPEIRALLRAAVARLGEGVAVVERDGSALGALNAVLDPIILHEAWQVHGAVMAARPEHYGAPTARLFRAAEQVTDAAYAAAQRERAALVPAALALLDDVDVLLGPAAPFVAPDVSPPIDTEEGAVEGMYSSPYNLTGQPAIVIPCGTTADGSPVGLQLAALPGADAALLAAAAVLERMLAA